MSHHHCSLAQPLLLSRGSHALSHPPLHLLAVSPPWSVPSILWLGTLWHHAKPRLTRPTSHKPAALSTLFFLVKPGKYIFMEGSGKCWWTLFPIPFHMQPAVSLGDVPVCLFFPTCVKVAFTDPYIRLRYALQVSHLLTSLTRLCLPHAPSPPKDKPPLTSLRGLVFLNTFKRNLQEGTGEILVQR